MLIIICKKHVILLLSMWKTVVLLNIYIFFQDTLYEKNSVYLKQVFCNIINAFIDKTYWPQTLEWLCIYIYIYIYREREREREILYIYTKMLQKYKLLDNKRYKVFHKALFQVV